jgi:hypothetical protein
MDIEFVSIFPELMSDETVLPQPTNKYIPEWYKKMPLMTEPSEITGRRTIKSCPAIADLFSSGYVLPAWSDIAIKYTNGLPQAKIGQGREIMNYHDNDQFLDYIEHDYLGKTGKFVFKLLNPWQIITSKGWSVLQLPLLYDFNKNFSVLNGIIDTDIWHQANLQLMYYGNEEVVIPKGTPLVQYIPIKREKHNLIIRTMNAQDEQMFRQKEYKIQSKFARGYSAMRKMKEGKINDHKR